MIKSRGKGNIISLVILVSIALIVLGIKKCNQSNQNYPEHTITNQKGDWRHHKLIYTKHARCRMECRDISEEEVAYILEKGIVNAEKSKEESDEAEGHCPSFALDGNTKDGQHVRIVFGACDKITKVITCIDLGVEHRCNCN